MWSGIVPARDSRGRFVKGGGTSGGGATATNIVWEDNLTPRLAVFDDKMDAGLHLAVEWSATRAEAAARRNARWKDQTTNARNGLMTKPFHTKGKEHGYVLHHSVPYGIWLEVRWSGKYAIIMPTILDEVPELMKVVRGVFRTV